MTSGMICRRTEGRAWWRAGVGTRGRVRETAALGRLASRSPGVARLNTMRPLPVLAALRPGSGRIATLDGAQLELSALGLAP